MHAQPIHLRTLRQNDGGGIARSVAGVRDRRGGIARFGAGVCDRRGGIARSGAARDRGAEEATGMLDDARTASSSARRKPAWSCVVARLLKYQARSMTTHL